MSKTPSSSTLEERLDRMQREIAGHQRRLVSRTRFTGFLAAIVLVALACYFYYGYKMVGELTEPKTLVAQAEQMISTNLPEVRKSLQDEIIRSAPEWAARLSEEVQNSLPDARKQLEDFIVARMDEILESTATMTEEQFRGFLKDNHDLLERGFADLSASPQMAEQTVNEITTALDKQLAGRMQADASQLFDTLLEMNKKISKLHLNKNLNQEQALERRILMLTRRLQLETVEPPGSERSAATLPKKPPLSDVTPVANETSSGDSDEKGSEDGSAEPPQ
jgi:hypothetical protein